MPYMLEGRVFGPLRTQGVQKSSGSSSNVRAQNFESVFTYRSRNSPAGKLVQPASLSKSLAGKLVERRKYLDEQIELIEGRPGNPTVFSTTDMGHQFGVQKFKTDTTPNSLKYISQSSSNNCLGLAYYVQRDGTVLPTSWRDVGGDFFFSKGLTALSLSSWRGALVPDGVENWTGYATKHIQQMNPHKNAASFAATVAELARGDIPRAASALYKHANTIKILRTKFKSYKDFANAGGRDFLNAQFGWAPIMRDVNNAVGLLMRIDEAIFASDSSRRQRDTVLFSRSGTHSGAQNWGSVSPLTWTWADVKPTALNPQFSTVGNASYSMPTEAGVFTRVTLRTTARFLTGAKPTMMNNSWLDRGMDLLGLKITPELVWELTPWSWLIDWFANIGTVLQNLSTLGINNTILNYGYSTMRLENRWTAIGKPPSNLSPTGNFVVRASQDAKVRTAASPFGFSMSFDQLNVGQVAILTALGLTRLR